MSHLRAGVRHDAYQRLRRRADLEDLGPADRAGPL